MIITFPSDISAEKHLHITYSIRTSVDLAEVCECLDINLDDVVAFRVRWHTLSLTLNDGRELEFELDYDKSFPVCLFEHPDEVTLCDSSGRVLVKEVRNSVNTSAVETIDD